MTSRVSILPYVRSFSDRDGSVVFDIRNGKYYSFNGIGGRIWSGLQSGSTPDALADELSREFTVPRERVERDIAGFIVQMRDKDLVWTPNEVQRKRREGLFSRLGGVLLSIASYPVLVFFDLLMHVFTFRALHGVVKSFPVLIHRKPDVARARRICERVNRAATFYFKRAWCLQRSATAVCFLRVAGYPAQLVIGAQKVPFFAHAWAELAGEMVNDHEDHEHDNFVVLDRC